MLKKNEERTILQGAYKIRGWRQTTLAVTPELTLLYWRIGRDIGRRTRTQGWMRSLGGARRQM